ncbi:MAG: protein kinase [Gemmataceae bacterium]|nr:protein kinase [Gemmataceae bacterium]
MPLIIRCPNAQCAKSMQVPDNAAGKKVACPTCKTPFIIPATAAAPATTAPATTTASSLSSSSPSIELSNGNRTTTANTSSSTPTACPACGSKLLEGAVACMDCGFMITADTGAVETEGPPNLCTNPACGVANPPGERNCQRCGNPLPIAGGTVLHGRYRLDKLLKMGGFGAVYKATDTKANNREVAIKDMIGNDPQEFAIRLNFFRREAEILRSLEMVPIVPRVFDFIHQGQTAHLVMEFIRGRDLLDIMEANSNKPFPIPMIVEWGKSVCDVLQTMHSQHPPLIHRDLKPDNIMLLEDKKSIKMIDFGTARDLGRSVKERMAGKTRVYTEGYAPPEQIVGKPEARSDLFSLAATMYHLATGKAPEGFYTAKELETQLADPASPIPQQHRWFYEMIRINLAEDVNDRYFSAKEIRHDLDRQQVTKEVPCAKCKTPNPVRSPYCVKCAESLTDPSAPCAMCGKFNHMGCRFCIHCGNRLR